MGNSAARTAARLGEVTATVQAAEMRVRGMSWGEIANEQGAANESVPRLRVERYIDRLPKESVELWKQLLLRRLDKAHKAAEALLEHSDERVVLKAAATVANIASRVARITGVEQSNVFVQVNTGATVVDDLSRLTLDELKALKEMRLKISSPALLPAIDVKGTTVPTEEEDHGRSEDSGT